MAPGRSPRLRPQIHTSQEGAGTARRRSQRLHPQIQAGGEGAGVTRRRSPRSHPQIQASGERAGVTRRRSLRLHPQINASEEGAGVTRRIRRRHTGTSSAEHASLPDDDDMPQPSLLSRAPAVCKLKQQIQPRSGSAAFSSIADKMNDRFGPGNPDYVPLTGEMVRSKLKELVAADFIRRYSAMFPENEGTSSGSNPKEEWTKTAALAYMKQQGSTISELVDYARSMADKCVKACSDCVWHSGHL